MIDQPIDAIDNATDAALRGTVATHRLTKDLREADLLVRAWTQTGGDREALDELRGELEDLEVVLKNAIAAAATLRAYVVEISR